MLTKIKYTLIATLILLPLTASAGTQEELEKAYNNWATALSSANPDNIVSLYGEESILLATIHPEPISNQQDRRDYFAKLMKNPNLKVTLNSSIFQQISDNAGIVSGIYTFSFTDKDERVKTIPARFSFVFTKEGGKWLISNHHSSKIPEQH